jgi:hypothetical protein
MFLSDRVLKFESEAFAGVCREGGAPSPSTIAERQIGAGDFRPSLSTLALVNLGAMTMARSSF